MKYFLTVICSVFFQIFLLAASTRAMAFDESVNHAPDFQIFQYDPRLKDEFGSDGSDKLCWPSSLAHRMIYFQKYRKPNFAGLQLDPNAIDNVKKFAEACHTSMRNGTSQREKIPCILKFFNNSHYSASAFAIGTSAPSPNRRPVEVDDLREALLKDYGVILHVGWLRYDGRRHAWIEKGSHSLNSYGFDYDRAWGKNRIILKVANPGMNYANRTAGNYFDSVEVTRLVRQQGITYPPGAEFVLSGPGFNAKDRLAVLDDIFVFAPRP